MKNKDIRFLFTKLIIKFAKGNAKCYFYFILLIVN